MSAGAARRSALLALLLALGGCAGVREALAPAPQGEPSSREGWVFYTVGALRFEAPAAWGASGGPRHLKLVSADEGARLEVSTPEEPFASSEACLADAQALMKKGDAMERARRHPTRLAGLPAQTLEGDQGAWHVWAWAACDGGTQYQLFLTARSPAPREVIDAVRALEGARIQRPVALAHRGDRT
ncbi:MAG: hypothetical protein QM767_14145 [Anaeromyxobacter sp.]